MVVAPVFLYWDETIPSEFASKIQQKINTLLDESFASLEVEFHLAIVIIGASGSELIRQKLLQPFKRSWLTDLSTDAPSVNQPITIDIGGHFVGAIDSHPLPPDCIRPLVLVVSNRRTGPNVAISQVISNLLDGNSKPRLAVLGMGVPRTWSFSAESSVLQRKEVLANLRSPEVEEIQRSFTSISDWLLEKVVEQSSTQAYEIPLIQIPVATDSKEISDELQLPERPIITPATQSSTPALSTAPLSKPAASAPSRKPAERPSIVFGEEQEVTTVVKKQEQVTQPERPTTSVVNKIERAVEVAPLPNVVVQEESVANQDNTDGVGKVANRIMRTVGGLLGGNRGEKTPASIDKEPDYLESRDLVIPEFPRIGDIVDSTFPQTADGQLITDFPSSLNAKPWYSPTWKKLPVNGPSRDLELTAGSVGDLRLMAGSTRGTKHQFYKDENEDAFHVAQTATESHLIVAVADGVSSAKYSAYGSKVLSYVVGQSLIRQIEEAGGGPELDVQLMIDIAIRSASDRVQNWRVGELYAPSEPPDEDSYRQVSATFSVAVIDTRVDENGSRKVFLACVGDSPCYTLRGDNWTLRSTATKEGELLEHGTQALPVRLGADPCQETFEFVLANDEVLVLMTDGIGTALASGDTPVGRWLAPRLYGPKLTQDFAALLQYEFLNTLGFDRQGEDDDRTLAVVYDYQGVSNAIASLSNETAQVSSTETVTCP